MTKTKERYHKICLDQGMKESEFQDLWAQRTIWLRKEYRGYKRNLPLGEYAQLLEEIKDIEQSFESVAV